MSITSVLLMSCSTEHKELSIPDGKITAGSIEILNKDALNFINADAKISVRGSGYKWTEGPLWIEEGGYLIFSDIPNNRVMKYHPTEGVSVYLEKSGATGLVDGDYGQGSNGMLLNQQGQLVLMQQGDRRVAMMDAPLSSPKSRFITLASSYNDKRLNSPNDADLHSDGSLFFTDPPYGLKDIMNDERKELSFQGIYRLANNGELTLLDDEITYPNGIGLSHDEKTLYVAVSDEEHPHWLAYDLSVDGKVSNKRMFIDASQFIGVDGEQGMPDGMVIHSSGNIFATGPGGVWLITPKGEVLAKIKTGKLTANCTLSSDEQYLFMTAHDTLMSVPLK